MRLLAEAKCGVTEPCCFQEYAFGFPRLAGSGHDTSGRSLPGLLEAFFVGHQQVFEVISQPAESSLHTFAGRSDSVAAISPGSEVFRGGRSIAEIEPILQIEETTNAGLEYQIKIDYVAIGVEGEWKRENLGLWSGDDHYEAYRPSFKLLKNYLPNKNFGTVLCRDQPSPRRMREGLRA